MSVAYKITILLLGIGLIITQINLINVKDKLDRVSNTVIQLHGAHWIHCSDPNCLTNKGLGNP